MLSSLLQAVFLMAIWALSSPVGVSKFEKTESNCWGPGAAGNKGPVEQPTENMAMAAIKDPEVGHKLNK